MSERVSASSVLDRVLVLEMVRVTEKAAVAASKWIGRGDNDAADAAAVEAMREALNQLPFDGTVVIGEGERDEAPMLYIGEKVGSAQGSGPKIDIALDPLEGTTLTASAGPNALAVLAIAEEGGLLNAPDTYMDKLAIGPNYPEGTIDLSRSVESRLLASRGQEHDRLQAEMRILDRRIRLVNRAIFLTVLSAVLICLVVVLLFAAGLTNAHYGTEIALLFIASMIAIGLGFSVFLWETRIAARAVRIRTELLEHAPED